MRALIVHVRLLEPVLVAQGRSGEENSATGLPFIPGSALRGALIARYLESNPGVDLAAKPEARRLFLDGAVRYLNAYPWHEDSRLLPRPFSWFTAKREAASENARILDGAVTSLADLEQPKPPKGEFCFLSDVDVALYTPPRQLDVHITLNDPNRRGDDNQVYRYDALAEGEEMVAAILIDEPGDVAELQALLKPAELQIGAALSAGYGRVRILSADLDETWQEVEPGEEPDDGGLVVTLLSDAILRNGQGQVVGDLNAALAARLGLPDLAPVRCYRRLRLTGGYSRKWSLPLPQAWALQAGSVYVYGPDSGLEVSALDTLVETGIGERRAEGFGRLAVNWHTRPVIQRYPGQRHYDAPPELSPESKLLAWQFAQRRLRLLLDRRLAEAVTRAELANLPPNTQLSRVRSALQAALARGQMGLVHEHLDHLKGARELLRQARVNGVPMLDWIRERAENLDVQATLLQGGSLPRVAGQSADLTEELKLAYTARLIDGVMKKAIQRNQEVAR